jgi:signal transduction histidine kinase/CheY-like chemotaxis protein
VAGTKDGTHFRAHVVLNAIRDKDGELIGLIKITRDETERHKAQEALDQAREALFQSQKTEAIGKLTGGVAHDFNNLLAVVIGNLELLRKRLADDKLSALVDNALLGAKRGAALTQRMLVFARRTELTKVRVDIPSLVHGMSEIFQRSIGSEIVLETRFPVGLPAVLTDPHQLETGLLNLVVNARDAIEGGGTIVIGGRAGQPGGGKREVHVYVSDSGAGMDNETLRRAGEPFFTTKGVGKGTGLGLSMVQGLAEQSGGKIDIFSKIGQGTTVELVLPAAAPQQEAIPSEAPPETVVSAVDPMSILVVDDDMLVLMGTQAMLEDLGHTVVSASSGADALRILKDRSDIDLLITDQAMPQMPGLALAHEAKALHPELPIVIATGYAELPKNGFPITRLAKPFLQADLQVAILEAKGQHGA